jgi:hypothetical protein
MLFFFETSEETQVLASFSSGSVILLNVNGIHADKKVNQ